MRETRGQKPEARGQGTEDRSQKFLFCILYSVFCFLLFTGCTRDSALPLYERAEELFSKMDYIKAVEVYNTIVSRYPESPYASPSQYKIGLIYNLYLNDAGKAMNAYSTLILLYPKSKEVLFARQDMADVYMKQDNYRKAIGEYQWLLENTRGEQREQFQFQIAMAYLKLTDIRQARIELQEIIKNSPNSNLAPQVQFQIANTYYLEDNCQEAIRAYDEVVSLYSSSPYTKESTLGKAICLEERGNMPEALKLYKELEKSYPNPAAIRVRIDGIESREKKNTPVAFKEN